MRERVASRPCLGERIGADRAACEPRKVLFLQVGRRVANQRIDYQCVLDVDEDGNRGVDPRQRFNRQHRVEEPGAGASLRFGDLDGHHAKLEQLVDELARNLCLLIHLPHAGTDLAVRKVVHAVPEQRLVFPEGGQSRESFSLSHVRLL